jgi:membrane-associated phospholipid phosphatase
MSATARTNLPGTRYTPLMVVAGFGLLAAALTFYIVKNPYFPGDLAVTRFCQALANPVVTLIMRIVSYILYDWKAAALTALGAILIYWRIGRREAALLAGSTLLSLFSNLLKILIERPRPTSDLVHVLVNEPDYSFPSSHACLSMLLYGILIYILRRRLKPGLLQTVISGLLAFLIGVTGVARVYLGAHWYSDVIGGYLYGGFFLTLLIFIFERLIERPKPLRSVL